MSERRACRVIGCCRMTMRYEVVRQDDPALRERLKELAKARRRFGYRRLHVFLRREGHQINHKRLFRIVTIRRVPRLFDLHAALGAVFCCFFQFQGSNS